VLTQNCLVRIPDPNVSAFVEDNTRHIKCTQRTHTNSQLSNTAMLGFLYTYRYSPLPLGSDIRLLRLKPDEDEIAPIQCELFNYSLQKSTKGTHLYEALSYVWGDPKETLPIRVDGDQFPVTVKLHEALLRLRDRSIERIIWVDAVCIDQENSQEKEHQIQLMAKIYGQANRVIIWLGEAADDSDRAVEEIRVAGGKKSTNSSNETIQRAIRALLGRVWFRRIWVREQTLDNIAEITKSQSRYFRKLPQLGMS
jgi:hypothetical protein